MGTSHWTDTAKQQTRRVNFILFAVCALCLFLPFYQIEQGSKTYFYTAAALLAFKWKAVLLVLAPSLGLLAALVFSAGRMKQWQAAVLGLFDLMGLILLFLAKPAIFEYGSRYYHLALGSMASMITYMLGAAFNALALLRQNKK